MNNDDNKKGELYLSFAGFVYYADKRNYKIQGHIDPKDGGFISFWFDKPKAKNEILEIKTGTVEYDCGSVIVNSIEVLQDLFSAEPDRDKFIEDLLSKCKREYGPRPAPGSEKAEYVRLHCKIPISERTLISTTIHTGETIECLNKN